ncbi:hypothetical protein ACWCPT_29375 [Streptomyces sp. NPDC002308]
MTDTILTLSGVTTFGAIITVLFLAEFRRPAWLVLAVSQVVATAVSVAQSDYIGIVLHAVPAAIATTVYVRDSRRAVK